MIILERFIMTQDENVAAKFINAGYKPLVNSGGSYIFENTTELNTLCFSELNPGTYIFTNKLFI